MQQQLDASAQHNSTFSSALTFFDPCNFEHDSWATPNHNNLDEISILLVGDSSQQLNDMLTKSSLFESHTCEADGFVIALELISIGNIDIVIVDTSSDTAQTFSFLDFIKSSDHSCECIVLDNSGDTNLEEALYAAGAADVRSDSNISHTVLQHIIKNTFSKKRMSEEYHQEVSRMSHHLVNMAHDLKTDLHSISIFNECLGTAIEGNDKERQRQSLHGADDNIRRMNHLIIEMLDFGAVSLDSIALNFQSVDVLEMIFSVCEDLNPFAEIQGLSLDYPRYGVEDRHSPKYIIDADPDRLYEIISNLISNGLKYTDNGGVCIGLNVDLENDSQISITVEDSGIGIRPTDFAAIFNQFKQVHKKNGAVSNSTGLGLPITLELIKKHNGRISVQSEFGVGSIFTVTLPIHNASS